MQLHVHTRAVPFPISPDISFNSKLVRLEVNADERILRLNPEFQFQTGAIRSKKYFSKKSVETTFQFQTGAIRSIQHNA